MQYPNLTAFRDSLFWLNEGEELTTTFSVNTLDLIIGLGEERIFAGDNMTSGLRASTMIEPLSATVTDNAAPLPADLLQLSEVRFSGERPLEILPLDRLRALEADDASGGTSRFCAQDGDTLRFWPAASGTVLGSYYAKPASVLTGDWSDHTTLARYPALYTYACLFEGAIFLGKVEQAAGYEARYRQLADGANEAERMRVYGGGPLRMRTR